MTDVTPEMIARMVLFNGLGYTHREIAAQPGIEVSESTVGKYLGQVEDEARATDPYDTFWTTMMGAVFNEQVRAETGNVLAFSMRPTTDSSEP